MEKECFSQDFVDSTKFKECVACPLLEECTGTVYLQGAASAANFGQALGLLVGLLLAIGAALAFAEYPAAAGWGTALCLVYLVAVFRAGKEYGQSNRDGRELLLRKAKAK